MYLEDVLDHVVRGLEEIGGCIEMCDSTKEEFKSLRDQRTNDVLYTLTIVTTLFVPLQFLTGLYGCVRVHVCVGGWVDGGVDGGVGGCVRVCVHRSKKD